MSASTTTLVPIAQGALRLHGREYPLLLRREAAPVHTPFDELRQAVVRSTSLFSLDPAAPARRGWFGRVRSPRSARARLFEAYTRDLGRIGDAYREAAEYLTRAVRASVADVDSMCARCADPATAGDAVRSGVCAFCRRSPRRPGRPRASGFPTTPFDPGGVLKRIALPPLPNAPAFGIEAAVKEPAAIRAGMLAVLERVAAAFVGGLIDTLDLGVDERQFGLLAGDGRGNARYHFYTIRPTDVELRRETGTGTSAAWTGRGRVETTSSTTTREVERTVTLRYHLHDLIEVRTDPIRGYTGRAPARVSPLFHRVPALLEPFLTVVSGTQIREVTADLVLARGARTESVSRVVSQRILDPVPVYLPDPAVVLGGVYVLAGWGEEE
jgi:hypothetical protein